MRGLLPEHRSDHISIFLEGEPLDIAQGTTLSELVQRLGHEPSAVATAVNGMFFPRSMRHMELQTGDRVLCFQPIVGG